MSRTAAAFTTLVVMAGLIVGLLLWQENRGLEPQMRAVEAPPAAPEAAAEAEPEIRYPVAESAPDAEPVPPLDESDDAFRSSLGELIGAGTFRNLFNPQYIVRNIVVTIDNLPREVVADRLRPIKPAAGTFQVQRDGTQLQLDPANAKRYAPYVTALERIDAERLASLYTRFYPLFQTAYRELGYPKAYFNDRLVTVIDHMLAAPALEGPVALEQPHIFYRYADPDREAASAGHKLMWRMGNDNAARVKAKLREIRAAVTASSQR